MIAMESIWGNGGMYVANDFKAITESVVVQTKRRQLKYCNRNPVIFILFYNILQWNLDKCKHQGTEPYVPLIKVFHFNIRWDLVALDNVCSLQECSLTEVKLTIIPLTAVIFLWRVLSTVKIYLGLSKNDENINLWKQFSYKNNSTYVCSRGWDRRNISI